jgi:iron complex transport system ATP-binding protein
MSGVVDVCDLNFCYGCDSILRQVFFDAKQGDLLMILGPNGSGKTTLLKCLMNLLSYEGTVTIMDKNPQTLSAPDRAGLMAYVPQNHNTAFPYRIIDVVVSGRTASFGLAGPAKNDFNIAFSALETVGLSNYAERPYTQISGGELRLVFLARALAQQSSVLFLDEPTSNLDIKNRVLTMKILKRLADSGNTMILTEHDPNLAAFFANHLLLLKDGRVMGNGTPNDILTTELLQQVYDIPIQIIRQNSRIHIFPE